MLTQIAVVLAGETAEPISFFSLIGTKVENATKLQQSHNPNKHGDNLHSYCIEAVVN